MTDLPESSAWEPGIYQLETTDPVVGGPPNIATKAGASNIATMQLGNRTRWLYDQVAALAAMVGAATTAVAGIVKLNDTVTSISTTEAATANAVKTANDNASSRVPQARTVGAGGLATGGGDLSVNRTITVSAATQAEAEAGAVNDKAMTPLRVAQAIAAQIANLIPDASTTVRGIVQLVHSTASTSQTLAPTAAALKVVQDNANSRAASTLSISTSGLASGGGNLTANRTIDVKAATFAQAQAGTDNTVAMTPLRVKHAIDAQVTFTKEYQSGDLTIVSGGQITLNHGLGVVPKVVIATMKCLVAENGFTVGSLVETVFVNDPTSANEGLGCHKTGTQLIVRIGTNGPPFLTRGDNGQAFFPTPSSWALIIGAYA